MRRPWTHRLALVAALLASLTFAPGPAQAERGFTRHRDRDFNFEILIPDSWKKQEFDLVYKHITVLSPGPGVEITITASRYDPEEERRWKEWKRWYLRDYGEHLRRIIATGEIAPGIEAASRLILFEYTRNRRKILERLLVARSGPNLIVIECRAPFSDFYRYDCVFNAVMGSYARIEEFFRSPAGE